MAHSGAFANQSEIVIALSHNLHFELVAACFAEPLFQAQLKPTVQ
jgi:hypothetical protein